MCLVFVLLDLIAVCAVVAFVFWVLAHIGIFAIGGAAYVLLAIAILLAIAWIALRVLKIGVKCCCSCCP